MNEFRGIKFYDKYENYYDFSKYYEVSNNGLIKSLNYNHTGKEGILKNHIAGGYEQTLLVANNIRKYSSVNRLVAFAFPEICGEYFKGAVCNHKDENKLNNNAENLEWISISSNNTWGTRINRVKEKTTNGKCSKKFLQYDLEHNFIKEWPSAKEIERTLGFPRGNIIACAKGKYKQAYGFVWKYKETA